MPGKEIYEEFIKWFGNTWIGLPESEYLRPMIESYYTPEEAEFLTGFPFAPKSLEELADIKDMDMEELAPKLKELAKKGMIYESIRGESVRYKLADSMFVFFRASLWHGRDEEPIKSTAPWINKYYSDTYWEQFRHTKIPALRTIPIEKTIDHANQVLPFEDVVKVVDDREYYTVSDCPCRHRYNLDPDSQDCQHPREVCLHFDELGHYIVENGLGREITRDETLEILKRRRIPVWCMGSSAGKKSPTRSETVAPATVCGSCPIITSVMKKAWIFPITGLK